MDILLTRKLIFSPIIYLALLFCAVVVAFLTVQFGVKMGLVVLVFVIGVPVVLYSFVNLKFGILVLFVVSYFLQGLNKFIFRVPLGIILDLFLFIMVLSLLISKSSKMDFTIAKSPISYVVLLWITYNLLEFFNPLSIPSAWVFVVRGIAVLMLFYFVMLYAIDSLRFAEVIINFWIGLSLLGALYGLFQEFHGLLPFELQWVTADEFRFKLIHNWGRFRIFSFFNDPTVFGLLMSFSALFCVTLLFAPYKLTYKLYLSIAAAIMLLAMIYSGTRTAYVMFPAGFIFFAILTFQRATLIVTAVFLIVGGYVIFSDIRSVGPLTTNSLNRIRSAFAPGDDPSFRVREQSQAYIKPYIQSHPFGAGLGSIGIWGSRFNPDSPLSEFAPDSGYVRVAVELGWVGLLIYCAFFFVILLVGIRNYFRIHDPKLRTMTAGLVAVVFSIVVSNYPQQALIQVPNVFIFYAIMSMLVKLREFDTFRISRIRKVNELE